MNTKPAPKTVVIATGIYAPDIGGPATHLAQFVPELVARDVQVRVVTFGDEASETDNAGVSVVRVARGRSAPVRLFAYVRALWRTARGVDLIYVHDISMVGLAAYLVHLFARVPYVLRIGGDFIWEQAFERGATTLGYHEFQGREPFPYSLRRRIAAMVARSAEAVVVPSRFLADAVAQWGVPQERLHVVHNAIDEALSAGNEAATHPLVGQMAELQARGIRVAVASGRFVRWKHFDLIVEALVHAPDVHLLLVGAGPEEAQLRDAIDTQGLSERVTIQSSLGRHELREVLAAADCFVLPSEGDTFSFVALEAFLAGTPVLLAHAGAFPEIFGPYEGEGVYFLEDISADALAVTLAQIDTYTVPSEAAMARIRKAYSIEEHFQAVWGMMAPRLTNEAV